MLLLEPALHDELVAAVYGAAGPQLREQEGQQVLRLPVKHLRDLGEVREGSLLGAHPHNLEESRRVKSLVSRRRGVTRV